MPRCLQQQQSCGAEAQHMADRFRWLLAEKGLQHGIQRSHPPQHRGGQAMRCRAVARLGGGKCVQGLFERPTPIQDRGQQVERSLARGIGHQRAAERQAI
jgi:hypothetical protein